MMVNNYSKVCCQKKEEMLKQISIQGASIFDGVSEWIKWTIHKKICKECKIFRTDSINMMHESATKAKKQSYIEKYFTVK